MLTGTVSAQVILTGKVRGGESGPVGFATVSVLAAKEGRILAYAITAKDGSFQLPVQLDEDSLYVRVSHVGYKDQTRRLANQSAQLDFYLEQDSHPLEDIIVKSPPVYEYKDTLNYHVSAFRTDKDRVIADIIKKLPGVELRGGRIFYRGQEIQRYLVEGLNLMENQYSLLNENLPAGAVQKVQIIKHDQPVRLLDSLDISKQPALNLKLKKYLTTGLVKIGAGMRPLLWDVNVTPMVFKKDLQMLSSFQSSNAGRDLEPFAGIEPAGTYGAGLLGIMGLTPPELDQDQWLDNHGNFVSGNLLKKMSPALELRGGVSLLNNFDERQGSKRTVFNLPDQNIKLLEQAVNHYNHNLLKADFKLEHNNDRSYYKDQLTLSKRWLNDLGHISGSSGDAASQNADQIRQRYKEDILHLENQFSGLFPVKRQLVGLISTVGYYELPQQLSVYPGQFDSLVNDGATYESLNQTLNIRTFYTTNSASITKALGAFTLSPSIGFDTYQQYLASRLEGGKQISALQEDDFSNDGRLSQWGGGGSVKGQFKNDKWRATVQLPLHYRTVLYTDKERGGVKSLRALVFAPSGHVSYQLSSMSELTYTLKRNVQFGRISNIYMGYLLTHYRSLQNSVSDIPRTTSFNHGVHWHFEDPLHQLFITVGYSVSRSAHNILYSTEVGPGGAVTIHSQKQPSKSRQQGVSLSVNKYILPIKSSVKLSSGYSQMKNEVALNDQHADLLNNSIDLGIDIDISPVRQIEIVYEGRLDFSQMKIAAAKTQSLRLERHRLSLHYFPAEGHMVVVGTKYYTGSYVKPEDSWFLNASYRYSFGKKRKYDLTLELRNILNAQHYHSIQQRGYLTEESSYLIRPRQLLLRLGFNF